MQFALAQGAVVGLGLGTQGEEAGEERGVLPTLAFVEQLIGMVRLVDLLAAAVAARMLGDELVAAVEADPLRFGPQLQERAGVGEGHAVAVGLEVNLAAVGGAHPAALA